MADMTTFFKNELFDHSLRGLAWTPPVSVWLALFSDATNDGGGGTELTGNGYARQQITFGAPTDGAGANTGALTFTAAGGAWAPITNCAVYDAATVGNMLLHDTCTNKTLGDGDSYVVAIGDLDAVFS